MDSINVDTAKKPLKEITVKSALHYHINEMPCNWDVNVYRGCGHGCRYCFAQYSHEYLGSGNFFGEIYAKVNVAEILDRELSRRKWRHARINLSGVTDGYQPVEAEMKLMPDIWKVLIKHKNPVVITTKSALILRDLDLVGELAGVTSVYVGASITMMDEELRKLFEPGAAPTVERFRVLEACGRVGCTTSVMLTPVLPLINDDRKNLEEIYRRAAGAKVSGLSAWPLNLRGSTKQKFLRFLEGNFPDLVAPYRDLYPGSEVSMDYWERVRVLKAELRQSFHIPEISFPASDRREEAVQLTLF